MVVIAHPDDESMAGGTIAKMAALGKAVRIVVLTNGDKGSGDFEMTSERLAELRGAEMHAAAAVPIFNISFDNFPLLFCVSPNSLRFFWFFLGFSP